MASFDVSWHYNRYFITQVAGSEDEVEKASEKSIVCRCKSHSIFVVLAKVTTPDGHTWSIIVQLGKLNLRLDSY